MSSIVIEPIRAEQAADLSALCNEIYPQFFTYLWRDGGTWYQEQVYNEAQLRTELEDPNVRHFFALRNGSPIGYMKVKLNSDLYDKPGGLEVERIYFLKRAAGKGFGKQLIEQAFDMARELAKRYVWLHVMDSSTDSIEFYRRRGFQLVGQTILPYERMWPEYRRMWQMRKVL